MALNRIRLTHFRNHAASQLVGSDKFNLLIGENGAGKTNILEAISLFAPGRGLRRAPLPDMAGRGGDGGFAVSAELQLGGHEPLTLGTGTHLTRPSRRIVHINSAESPAASLGEWLSLSWLTPAMDRLFMDSPGGRRRFLDRLVLALEPAHARNAARYDKALSERNRLLSDQSTPDPRWLDALDAQLSEAGACISSARSQLIDRLNAAILTQPTGAFARPHLGYHAGGPLESYALQMALAANRPRDRAAQRSLIGPHRDDLIVTLPSPNTAPQPAASCSTGEQKAMLIAITLAHAGLTGPSPTPRLLLLDEVAAHLDPIRRAALFDQLAGGPAQVWMTGTEATPFAAIRANLAQWHVADGKVLT